MNTHWLVNTYGDPISALQALLARIWQQAGLDAMLIPLNGQSDLKVIPRLVADRTELKHLNPFKPLMTLNAARLIPQLLEAHPNETIGVLLRPCELRALIEMGKHDPISMDRLLTICVDCLGTFPVEDYIWRLERKGTPEKMAQESLQFTRQGGIQAYRFRASCQFCIAQDAHGAQVNIGVLGLPARQLLLVSFLDALTAEKLEAGLLTDGLAGQELIDQRDRLLSRMNERHHQTRERVLAGLADILPQNVDELIQQFEDCGSCQKCMQVCPICSVDYPRPGEDQRFLPQDIMRWLVSCAGCGMCEQACPNHKPLSAIFIHIRQQLIEAFEYFPGESLQEELPIKKYP